MKYFLFLSAVVQLHVCQAQSTGVDINQLIERKKYVQAETELLKEIQVTTDKDVKDRLGEVYGYQGKWDDAIAIYKELTETYPQVSDYAFKYGGVMAKKAQNSNRFKALTLVGKIKENFKKAATLDSSSIEVHWALVDLYISLPGILGGSTSKAFDYAKKLKSVSPIDGYLAMGYVHEYDENPERAKQDYLYALGLLDDLESIERNQLHYQIGKICGEYDLKLDEGVYHMGQYIKNYTSLDGVPLKWAYFRMAKLYRKKKDKPKALKWIARALYIDNELEAALEEQKKIEAMGTLRS
ncbi:tetratricopeptide repeat protein [Ulvibacterium sp.]|uniref:tetratricopeptide repeat protein n=1 Tax=Ulvibacterium sp. TaxID=2665914 RepID=UPI0026257381|nr:tetratricopeptide repeat protein [Ulvibacterium sp.]